MNTNPSKGHEQMIIQIDMDGVLVDFQSGIDAMPKDIVQEYDGHLDDIPGIFSEMNPMEGAIEAFRELSKDFNVFICSTAPWENPTAWSDKIKWVKKYLGKEAYKKLTLTHNKQLVIGDFLIDDRTANGADQFQGEHIHFGTHGDYKDWRSVLSYFRELKTVHHGRP
jgi:5'-nucleotidase